MESNATDKPVPREIDALLSDGRFILRETQRAVTPFGGIAVFISFLEKIGLVKAIRQHMPIVWRSPNHIDPVSRSPHSWYRCCWELGVSLTRVCCGVIARCTRC